MKVITPLLIGIGMAIGFYFGSILNTPNNKTIKSSDSSFNMLHDLISYIDAEYVDPVSKEEIIDNAVVNILQDLDPHSYYISPDEYAQMNEPLEGNFDGIGIQFNIQKDTLVVIDPISGGPSAKVGVKAGDRIIRVNDSVIAGVGIRNSHVLKLLKGPKGTKVDLTIQRKGSDTLGFTITRDKIPIHSVNSYYMLNSSVGYIKVDRFGANTTDEFLQGVNQLKNSGANRVLVDLRGNGGGYMNAATNMLDAFFDPGKLLVYTQGKSRSRSEILSNESARFPEMEVVVLMDESSASASEIFAGAIQDHDRGVIVGRRSFGKGLVQEQTEWPNGSATRLTIARYYTPSGRCIQKPYSDGVEDYNEEYYHRYENGEMFSKDSIELLDSTIFYTDKGRKVFGGGGIIPDVFVPADTSFGSTYLNQLVYGGVIYDFAFDYADNHRKELASYADFSSFNNSFSISNAMLMEVVAYGAERGIIMNEYGLNRSREAIKRRVKAYIARNIWNDEGFYPIWNEDDQVIKEAMNLSIQEFL